jgi:hypothetical protein
LGLVTPAGLVTPGTLHCPVVMARGSACGAFAAHSRARAYRRLCFGWAARRGKRLCVGVGVGDCHTCTVRNQVSWAVVIIKGAYSE